MNVSQYVCIYNPNQKPETHDIYNRIQFMIDCECVLCMSDHIFSNDAKWQNFLFYKCCYLQADFRITSKGDKKGRG